VTGEGRLRHPVRACVFDAYGTLLDAGSAVSRLAAEVGPAAGELAALWRRKQLEYSWLRSLMGREEVDFWRLTRDALDHALDALRLDAARLRGPLLEAYGSLEAYAEVPATLRALREAGMPAAVLSNGSPAMLRRGLAAAGLADLLEPVISVEDAGVFKPAPATYLLATRALGVPAARVAFFSSNGWDVHGAASFGLQAVWVNRSGAAAERLPGPPAAVLADLAAVPALIAGAPP
jgi:2-haloacid dehalogenase